MMRESLTFPIGMFKLNWPEGKQESSMEEFINLILSNFLPFLLSLFPYFSLK